RINPISHALVNLIIVCFNRHTFGRKQLVCGCTEYQVPIVPSNSVAIECAIAADRLERVFAESHQKSFIHHSHFLLISEIPKYSVCTVWNTQSPARLASQVQLQLRSEELTSELQSRFDIVCRLM